MKKLEGEIPIFFMVWILVVASLSYCHTVGKVTSPGTTRLLAILPVVFFFFYLPLNLTTIFLGGPSSFFLAWLANFKLLLFALNKGPLATTPPTSISHFIPLACLPIKFRNDPKNHEKKRTSCQKSTLNYVTKALIFSTSLHVYHNKQFIHRKILLFLYSIYMYTGLELTLALVASLARVFLGIDFEPQFDEPYLATALQDFWGSRWNIMVSRILHPTVYEPVREISTGALGTTWAPIPAVIASFFVSAVMHELIFYYIGRTLATWELTCFFLLHGICLSIEIMIKKAFDGKWGLPAAVSGPLAMAFVVATGLWLFLPSIMVRCEPDVMAYREYTAFTEFMKSVSNFVKVSFLSIVGN
ncbi:long-chain-alcohol O-fatty-acyltransferase-like [Pyrus ussuriensis x Pyrus communis]|uniref:Long-chain-alcohol O-fatty-acyltransferase-like n=1 Tax=Pyrus ussuriensis x Pyrus communis TaxID=2448454 RepID=A0A5N5FI27_9ROSA|nr:long-chain-alcohol O-fatty-acyltransferase-like [Pyrus ussuriensis x Pyrus communis]